MRKSKRFFTISWVNALDDSGQFNRAEDAYLHSLSLESNDAPCHFDYGLALQRAGQLEEAAEQYRLALEADPEYFPARERLDSVEMFMRNQQVLSKSENGSEFKDFKIGQIQI